MKRVIAKLEPRKTSAEEFKYYTEGLIEKSRAEEGNISYDLYQNAFDKSDFLFIEIYRDQEAVNSHFSSEHLTSFLAKVKPLLQKEPEVLIDTVS